MVRSILFCFTSLFVFTIFFAGCKNKATMFSAMEPTTTGVRFINQVDDTDSLNVFDYLYYYNGAGVAVGDINNDGLPDLYFVANQGGNKLYLNKGAFKFEDVTAAAGVKGLADWSTGVTMADVNGDGWLDIYVCTVANHRPKNTGPASMVLFFPNSKNQLFINNKDGTFTERAAEYGVDLAGYSTQSAFFDYDKDGDLDLFLLQHSIHQTASYGDTSIRSKYSEVSGCKLFRNDGARFNNVTIGSGLYSAALGYGLGIAVSDFNNDGWDDVYIGNDFHENDYYFINNGDGSFSEQNLLAFGHESLFSMGNDAVDFNNDGLTDIITLDMLPNDEREIKRSMSDESHDEYENLHGKMGYQYQYSRNCLQFNLDNGKRFAETGLYSGVAATDWSWAVLGADYDLDGYKDIFITNGIKRRLNDLDFIRFQSSEAIQISQSKDYRSHDAKLFEHMRNAEKHNFLFLNNGDLKFRDVSATEGFNEANLSNGTAYADLDNDGDLDLVINNINQAAGIYRNNTIEAGHRNYLSIHLKGPGKNPFGIGTKIYAFTGGTFQFQQLQVSRGFLSSVPPVFNFGLDSAKVIDSVIVIWPDNQVERIHQVKSNQTLLIDHKNAAESISNVTHFIELLINKKPDALLDITTQLNIDWKHHENLSFNDFSRNSFIPHQLSVLGPAMTIGDINGDGLEDLFLGGAQNKTSSLFLQDKNSRFTLSQQQALLNDSLCEDVRAVFFDADNDGDKDLYVASGGGEAFGKSPALLDRLYLNDGKGGFSKSNSLPPLYENKGAVAIADYDKDGDMDIFVGGRADAISYGDVPNSYLMNNDGKGNFTLVTASVQGLEKVGMVSSAGWSDLNGDGYPELVVAGEWTTPVIFRNLKGNLEKVNDQLLNNLNGLWQSVFIADVNNDDRPDILLGNYGLNSKLTATHTYPLKLYCKDFDNNLNMDQVMAIAKNGKYYTFLGKETLEKQLPFIRKEYLSYDKMAGKTVEEIFANKLDDAVVLKASILSSLVLLNKGNLGFDTISLPRAFQWMPLFGFTQLKDRSIIAGGNFFGVMPFEGRYDNGMLPILKFNDHAPTQSGFALADGEVRDMQWIKLADGKKALIVVRNNLELKVFAEPRNTTVN